MRSAFLPLVLLAWLSVSACGPSGGAKGPGGAELGLVVVVILPTPEKLPFDPQDARLRAASAELGRIVGHPITFAIEAGLAAEWRSGFAAQLIDAVETVARDLTALRERSPVAFAHGAPLLERISCRYRAVATKAEGSLDAKSRTIDVVEPAHGGALVPRGLVFGVLLDDYEAFASARYLTMAPADVPITERRAYFDLVTGSRATRGDTEPLLDKRSAAIERLVELARVTGGSDPALAADLRKHLLGERRHFVDAYVHHGEEAQGAAPAFHSAERAWIGWLVATLPRFTAEEKLELAHDVFARGFNGKGYLPFAFPGFDAMGFALGVVDGWIAAGHPDTFATHTPETQLYEYIVCPHPKNADGDRVMGPRCDYHMYRLALENEAARKRLVDAIVSRRDPVFTEQAFAAITYADGREDPLARFLLLLRGVEADEAAWTIGARVLAEHAETGGARLVDEVRRLWAAYPPRRASLLVVLAAADPYDNGAVDWAGFAHDYGAPLDPALLGAMLDRAPADVARLPAMWPAFGGGWSRSAVIVPRLDAFLDHPARRDPQRPYTTMRAMFHRMCADGASGAADVAQVTAHLRGRARTRPGDPYVSLADEAPTHCGARTSRPATPRARGRQ